MYAQQSSSKKAEAGRVTVTLEGPVDVIARLVRGINAALAGEDLSDEHTPAQEPATLYVTRVQATQRTGIGERRLSAWVKDGTLTNYGTAGKMLFSLIELRQVLEQQKKG